MASNKKSVTRRTRQNIVPESPIDWRGLPAAARKLAPGGSGGKGLDLEWNLETPSKGKAERGQEATRLFHSSEKPAAVIKKKKKAVALSRSIIDNESTIRLISSTAVCRKCHSDIELSLPTVCVATAPTVQCRNTECDMESTASVPSSTSIPKVGGWVEMTQFAVNVLFVLAFIACGDGGVEAAWLIGLLALENVASMAKSSFSEIERKIGPFLCLVAEAAKSIVDR